jgi:transposase
LAVQVVPLPTYASWLNPIERLWRWLKQDVLHMHPFGEDWSELQATVQSFLERLTSGSRQLLRYTGLLSGT